jgi:hypothetical protein
MSNEKARLALIRGLRQALAAHREHRLFDIAEGWDEAAAVEHDDSRLSIALNLWEGWADSAAHQWQYYDGITADDWPRMASRILESLEQNRDIVDAELLKHFVPKPREPSALSRFVMWIRTLLGSP